MTPALEPDVLELVDAAREAGVHKDTLRKNWRLWSDPKSDQFIGFPLPFKYPPPGKRGRVAWRRTAVAEWKLARERALGAGRGRIGQPQDGGQLTHQRADQSANRHRRVDRERSNLLHLMERA